MEEQQIRVNIHTQNVNRIVSRRNRSNPDIEDIFNLVGIYALLNMLPNQILRNRYEDELYETILNESLNEDIVEKEEKNIKMVNNLKSKYKSECMEEKSCSICSDNFIENEDILVLKCEHIYHPKCIKEWVNYNSSCPICRKSIESVPSNT